jgi:D-glycero-D-manno-heptose 1,7-bisphosphate phosphatase
MGRYPLRPAVFLDRDGVLNVAEVRDGKPYPPVSLAAMKIVPEAPQCLEMLRKAGFLLVVVTNQPDIARGTQTRTAVDEIHAALRTAMPLDAIYVCPHDGAEGCPCRKPKPGMLLDAARDLGIDLPRSFMVGDRWRDVEAGQRAGCRTVFLDFGYTEKAPEAPADMAVPSLSAGVRWILSNGGTVEHT